MRKTNKASLAKELHKNVEAADGIPQPSARVIDGMALVQVIRRHLRHLLKLFFAEF